MKVLTKILSFLAFLASGFAAIFYVLMRQAKDERKAEEKENNALKTNLEALAAGEEAVKEERKVNEELLETAHSGNNLDAFNAINKLLSK